MNALHKHHIIPKHAGGTNTAKNLVKLTVPEHAEAHRLLWEQYGRIQDKVAWLALAGRIPEMEEAYKELQRAASQKISQKQKGRKHSPEHIAKYVQWRASHPINFTAKGRAKISETHKGKPKSLEHRAKIGEAHKGKPKSLEHMEKLRLSCLGRPAWNTGLRGWLSEKHQAAIIASNIRRGKINADI